MAVSVYTKSNEYSVPRGLVGFQERLSDGVYDGIEWFGDVSAQTVSVETENLTHESHEGGIGQRDLDTPIRITRSGGLTVDNCNAANVARFFGASVSTHTQASTPIVNELIRHIKPGRSWVLGNTSGGLRVRSVSSVAVDFKATARANTTAYTVGQIYVPATPNNHAYICTRNRRRNALSAHGFGRRVASDRQRDCGVADISRSIAHGTVDVGRCKHAQIVAGHAAGSPVIGDNAINRQQRGRRFDGRQQRVECGDSGVRIGQRGAIVNRDLAPAGDGIHTGPDRHIAAQCRRQVIAVTTVTIGAPVPVNRYIVAKSNARRSGRHSAFRLKRRRRN